MICLFMGAFCAAVSWPDEEGWVSLIRPDLQKNLQKAGNMHANSVILCKLLSFFHHENVLCSG
jgi:hypothetical protein